MNQGKDETPQGMKCRPIVRCFGLSEKVASASRHVGEHCSHTTTVVPPLPPDRSLTPIDARSESVGRLGKMPASRALFANFGRIVRRSLIPLAERRAGHANLTARVRQSGCGTNPDKSFASNRDQPKGSHHTFFLMTSG
jgi:hypothetical protein